MHYELDDASDSWHLGAVDPSGRVVGISSFYREACPARPEVPESFQLQFMAVDPSVQREGIGSSILSEGLRRLQSMGAKLLWASARDNAVPFYERFGFEVVPDSASLPASTGRPHHLILLEIQQQERREVGGGDRAPQMASDSAPVRTEPGNPFDLRGAWDQQSEAWTLWARAPEHDSYWRFGRAEFFQLLPAPGRLTLDVGCGEGRVSRDLIGIGHKVIALDASRAMMRATVEASPELPALVADAAALPVTDGCCDLVIAYMSLQDVDDMPSAVREVGRALEPGGHLCMAIVHPLNSAGRFASLDPNASFVIQGSYLDAHTYVETVARSGLEMTFSSVHRPIEAYFRALEEAGLMVESLREVPVGKPSSDDPRHQRWRRLPLFLFVRAVKGDRTPH
ncbi:MAG TPA: GNAT family N-acetyltransferase [Candidatus Dormibacteraeota bacterium]